MNTMLSRFRIESLHNLRNIEVVIKDNKLVLVGENGTGKSTVVNLITFFLTRQWPKMLNYEFKRIVAQFGNDEIVINRDAIIKIDPRDVRELSRRIPTRIARDIEILIGDTSLEDVLNDKERLKNLGIRYGIPHSILSDYLLRYTEIQPQSDELRENGKIISDALKGQVLYLPTYRRIEQDLRSIFPQLDLDEFRSQVRERFTHRADRSAFIELVEFGMEDVEFTIQRRLEEIKDYVRASLSNLTGTYLRDVIKGDYRSADLSSKLREIDEQTIEPILSRIPQAILTENERRRLRDIIQKIRVSGSIVEEDKVVAHFLSQLIDLYKVQQDRETDVREFVRVGNQYLSGKELVYDNSNFNLYVRQKDTHTDISQIQLRMLSSGEKQIVSLFSHIYLSGQPEFFVVIDEPELSLSVPWQKRFLPDILATQKCSGLIAVTHSPFIFENELDEFTHSLEEFAEQVNVIP